VGKRLRAFRTRRVIVGAVVSAFVASCQHAPQAAPSLTPPPSRVQFMGRVDVSDPEHPRFAWSGSGVRTRFSGRSLHVHLKDTGSNVLQVTLDGSPTSVLATNPTREDYEVVTGLADGTHDLLLTKRSEARMGELQFLGFDPESALASPAAGPSRRVELIGDSITAGYGNEGPGVQCNGSMLTLENETLAYGALASRMVSADHVTIAWSGKTIEEMAELYDRTLPSRPTSRWDFTKWTPDAVVINLGTNDFNHGDPGPNAFVRPYLAFVQRVRTLYPRAQILCTLGPMLTDSYPPGAHALTRARAYLTRIVSELRAAGDTKITFLEFASQDFANGLGCDYHPSLKTHRLMADQLALSLREKLGW
jgi:lysophospholipase L1-like esterase